MHEEQGQREKQTAKQPTNRQLKQVVLRSPKSTGVIMWIDRLIFDSMNKEFHHRTPDARGRRQARMLTGRQLHLSRVEIVEQRLERLD
jgi:hypothetical protein